MKEQLKNNKTAENRKIGTVKIVYLTLFLLIVGMVILYSSGTFVSYSSVSNPSLNSGNNKMDPGNDPHGGADLNALQKIKQLEASLASNYQLSTLLELGHLYNDSGFFQKAIETYKQYLKEEPRKPDVIVDMGVCYFNLQNYEEAKKVIQSALEINPKHQIAKFNLGIVNFSSGNIDIAKKWWQECIDINPNTEIAQKAKSLLESH
jgi:tetratricopeptide (TPR) repeat protein